MIRQHQFGLCIDPPSESFQWMNLHAEMEAVRSAIENLFVADACNSF